MDVERRIVRGHCARAARRPFRRRREEPRRAARRERRRHGAHSQSRRMEDARHGTGRLHVDVQPGRDRFQIRRSARGGLRLSRRERSRAGCVSSPSTRRRSHGTGGVAFRRERRRLWRYGDDARGVPILDAVAAAVVSPRRARFATSICGGCPNDSQMPKLETQAAGNYTFEAAGARLDGHGNAGRFDGRGRALRAGDCARHGIAQSRAQLFGERQRCVAQPAPFRGAARSEVARRRPVQRLADRSVHLHRQRPHGRRSRAEHQCVAESTRRLRARGYPRPRSISRWPHGRFARSSPVRSRNCRDRCSPSARSSPARR